MQIYCFRGMSACAPWAVDRRSWWIRIIPQHRTLAHEGATPATSPSSKMRWLALSFVAVAVACCSAATAPLFEGVCRAVARDVVPFGCHAAAFGAYLPVDPQRLPLRALEGDAMTACNGSLGSMRYDGAVVLVRRGDCVFQQKLLNVANAGAIGMIVVNTDDSPLQLGTLEFEPLGAFAVAVTRSDGDRLIDLVSNSNDSPESPDSVAVEVGCALSVPTQAWRRIEHLLAINAPLIAYETFFDSLASDTTSLDALLDALLAKQTPTAKELSPDELALYRHCSTAFPDAWDFGREASFHASVIAATLIRISPEDQDDFRDHRDVTFMNAALKLIDGGYYAHAASLLSEMGSDAAPTTCLLAFVRFLEGGVVTTLDSPVDCTGQQAQFNVTSAGLDIPHQNFLRLTALEIRESDRQCLRDATSETALTAGSRTRRASCCRRRIHSRSDDELQGDSGGDKGIRRRAFWFQSAFVEELYHALTIMGVVMDENGAFEESLLFFRHGAQLCEDWSLSLELRQALAIPIVFDSSADVDSYMDELHGKIHALQTLRRQHERVLSSLAGPHHYADYFIRPEETTYLRYTITPPTMFVGYQGRDVLRLQEAIIGLRAELFPSLNSRFQPMNSLLHAADAPQRRRIAFVSTWFRNHSVGKLILGVIKRLDRSKFHVMVFRCVHFLKYPDELTKEIHREADSYIELPTNLEDALALLRHEAIDVVVFPELGMDAWTLFLSHHRIAPVQCVFWGHPITTANPAIDYFITSEYFISDFFEDHDQDSAATAADDKDDDASWPGTYHGTTFSEQVVLFRGLSTFFTNKSPPTGRRPFERSRLHLPANARLYVCPQTLMKLHPDFDRALEAILTQDAAARIVLLSSPTQRVWKEQLRRRFRRTLGEAHRRILFFSTLPYEDFMGLLSVADVVLDPFPFGGGVTTLDALAVGTPVVTLPSAQTVPQLAAGFLRYMGLTETIASSLSDFVAIALAVARDAALRKTLHDRILAQHRAVYEDEATLDDWNAFLHGVSLGR